MRQLPEGMGAGAGKKGPKPVYDWDKILNGEAWELVKGTDFSCSIGSLKVYIYQQARIRGLKVSVSVINERTIHVQAQKQSV